MQPLKVLEHGIGPGLLLGGLPVDDLGPDLASDGGGQLVDSPAEGRFIGEALPCPVIIRYLCSRRIIVQGDRRMAKAASVAVAPPNKDERNCSVSFTLSLLSMFVFTSKVDGT